MGLSMPPRTDEDLFDADFIRRLERLRLQVRRTFSGVMRAERRSRRMGSSLEFADHRNYSPGDDPRRVDWSVFGRIERLMVKLYEEEEDLDVAILVDASRSMRWKSSSGEEGKFRLARELAAALGYLALHSMDRVGLWFFDGDLRGESGFFRGHARIHEILRFLRKAPDPVAPTSLAESLGRFGRRQKRRGLAIVISDCLDPEGYERGLAAVTGRHFDMHLLHILAADECAPALRGDLLLQDCETGGELAVTVSPAMLAAYREEVDGFLTGIRTWCARRGAGYSRLSAADAFEDVVLRMLRRDGLAK